MPAAPSILTITLNPALDITTATPAVLPAQKLRCGPPRYDAGGGGVNVSRAIRELGGDSRMFIALGGANGAHFRRLLETTGIESEIWETRGETRFSLTVMEGDSGQQFRFVLPGPEQPAESGEALFEALVDSMRNGIRYVVASGRELPGLPVDLYARLGAEAHRMGITMILDTSGPPLRAALASRPFLVKMDHFEAQEYLGETLDPEIAAHRTIDDILGRNGAEGVIVTIGENGAVIADGKQRLRIRPPRVEVRSAVGAGDSFTAALTLGLVQGWPLAAAARFGVAAAASSVTRNATELCQRAQTEAFFEAIAGDVVAVG